MTEEELQQELERMRQVGLDPLLCDTAVPLVDVPVLAGNPGEVDEALVRDYLLVPRRLVGHHPVFLVNVEGLSMQDADIQPGDRLEVQMGTPVGDGDIVVAAVDDAFTVKTLFTDDEGQMWLVPRNADYEPIPLTGRLWRIIGKVVGLRKSVPRASYSDCARAVMRQRRKTPPAAAPATDDQPRNLVFRQFHQRQRIDYGAVRRQLERVVVLQLKHRYEWYAAYRVLLDLGLLDDLQLSKFAQQMRVWFPDVAIQCSADTLGTYAVGHTAKAFTLWSSDAFRADRRPGQSVTGFNTLFHRCEELRAALFPLPTVELGLPF